jgi:hypothetical protein
MGQARMAAPGKGTNTSFAASLVSVRKFPFLEVSPIVRQACMLAPENEGIISRECDCRFLAEIDTGYLPRAAQTDSEILGTMLGGRQEMTPRGRPL